MKFLSDIEVEEGLKDSDGDLGTAGQVLSSTSTGTNWIDAGTIGGSITDNQIAVGASTANTIEGSDNFKLTPLTLGSAFGNVTSATFRVNGRLEMSDNLAQGATNLYIGNGAGGDSASGGNVGVGQSALGEQEYATNLGKDNSALGLGALRQLTLGNRNTAMGSGSLFYLTGTGQNDNTAVGEQAGRFYSTGTDFLTQSSEGVYIGGETRASANNISNEIVIGYGAIGGGSDTITLGNDDVDLLRIPGLNATSGQVLAYNTTAGGFEAATPSSGSIGGSIADNEIAVGGATANTIEGSSDFSLIPLALGGVTSARLRVKGRLEMSDNLNSGTANLYMGVGAGGTSADGGNTGVGSNALGDQVSATNQGVSNSALGWSALTNLTLGNNNVAVGADSLFYLTGTGQNDNTVIGTNAARYYSTGTDQLTQSSQGVYIGSDTRASANNISNEIAIGYGALGGGSNTITLGNSSVDTLRIPGLGNTNGYVLTYSTADNGFILAAGGGGGGIGGATVANQVAFGAASSTTDITSDSTFTFAKNGLTGSQATTLFEIGDGDSSDTTSYGSVFITAKQVDDSTSRARFQLETSSSPATGSELRGYLQCSGTSSDVTLLSNANLVLEGTGKVTIEPGSTNDVVMASSSGSGVGIGTTSVSKKLQVNGTIYSEQASGEVMIAGNSAFSTKYITIREGSNYAARWGLQATNDIVTSGVMLMASSKPMAFRSSTNIAFDSVSLSHLIIRASSTNGSANVGIGTDDPQSKLQVNGGIQIADDTDGASADKVGTFKYYTDNPAGIYDYSYVDMCMQTDTNTYEWVNVVTNRWVR